MSIVVSTPKPCSLRVGGFHVDGGLVVEVDRAAGEHGRRAWALERQVRLAAGTLVFIGLAAGIGLAVSAVTDTCAVGAAPTRTPWNREHSDPRPAETLDRLARRARAA